MTPDVRGEVLWSPAPDAHESTRLGRFLGAHRDRLGAGTYDALWRWSVEDLDGFWAAVVDEFGLEVGAPTTVLADDRMPGAVWFPGASLNYAAHALRSSPVGPAVISRSQTRDRTEMSMGVLRSAVARCRAGLVALGVGRGDRVAAYLPNVHEAIVAFLATASLGAVWTSCAPEFGVRSVVGRWSQIAPKALLAVDGYRYGDKAVDRRSEVAEIRAALPSLSATVTLGYLDEAARHPDSLTWEELTAEDGPLRFDLVAFDHPLYVLFSSGTTGLPKPIVHGHGGILLEHHKVLGLHHDLGPGDRFFWFSTTGWMMWNYLVSGLLVGATVVAFDGDPGHPDLDALWAMARAEGLSLFGTSAPFLLACRKAGLEPGRDHDLSALRTIGSTGAPLPAEGFRWVYEAVKSDVLLASVSGGTDVCTAFVGGSPLSAVRAGEISTRLLGARVEAFSPAGEAVVGEQGDLVITRPMPSMPIGLWGDDDGARLRAAYYADHPGVWTHGDWITVFDDGACVITGRSDATLNRGGVRMGTAELYSVIESFDEVTDSLIVHLEDAAGGPGELVLMVACTEGGSDHDDLRVRIAAALRSELSPRHVPDRFHVVPGVPRTLSGKKLEVPVKRILGGADPDDVLSRGSLANPETIAPIVELRGDR